MPSQTKATSRNSPAPAPEILTLSEAASYLRISADGLKADADAGRIPGRVVAGEWRFSRAGILQWLGRTEYRATTTVGSELAERIRLIGIPWSPTTQREAEEFIAAVSGRLDG